jgi:hypothetical protein
MSTWEPGNEPRSLPVQHPMKKLELTPVPFLNKADSSNKISGTPRGG